VHRTNLCDSPIIEREWNPLNGNELIKRLNRHGKPLGIKCHVIAARGKGSHSRLCFGDRFTTIKDRRKEIGKGLLKSMLDDLGVNLDDL